MTESFKIRLLEAMGAEAIQEQETIQSLWNGYGRIFKARLIGNRTTQLVIKHINPPKTASHPRGWNTNLSHQRKLKSYLVEMAWYNQYAHLCDHTCRIPVLHAALSEKGAHWVVLEDLNDSGFPKRKSNLRISEAKVCLSWLAHFHATFMGQSTSDLWEKGSYWHLDTRPDEWAAMPEGELKKSAGKIDQILDNCRYKTIIHGDAKVANFCFNEDASKVAAVDFQYVGLGCGMKDVVYFLGSCLTSEVCYQYETELLDHYFVVLEDALNRRSFDGDYAKLEMEWRSMYALAWTDFTRFLMGWMPGHRKLNAYSEKLMRTALQHFKRGESGAKASPNEPGTLPF